MCYMYHMYVLTHTHIYIYIYVYMIYLLYFMYVCIVIDTRFHVLDTSATGRLQGVVLRRARPSSLSAAVEHCNFLGIFDGYCI